MKKIYFTILLLLFFQVIKLISGTANNPKNSNQAKYYALNGYQYPEFYRGLYLNNTSARNFEKLTSFILAAKNSSINTLVLDLQNYKYQKRSIPVENVYHCLINNIHPIARIVVFPNGLKEYPVSPYLIENRLKVAEEACQTGFKEIQFDYIRFNDSKILNHLSLTDRYNFIEGFLTKARKRLAKYQIKISADVFGRIPLVQDDQIGQKMESLDKVVDIICPMAYPSHYWTKEQQHDPYKTVYLTSKKAKERTKTAKIVTYIQAFKWRMPPYSFSKYIQEQIKAVHDAGIKGFILWNARQVYKVPLKASQDFYENYNEQVSQDDDSHQKNSNQKEKIKFI